MDDRCCLVIITLKRLQDTNEVHTRVINIDKKNIAQNDEYDEWMI